uniref:Uncharacterized protein n=1 Tax=Arundo donax TaxID=35708 RepID=A0A0A9F9V9_ARUDO
MYGKRFWRGRKGFKHQDGCGNISLRERTIIILRTWYADWPCSMPIKREVQISLILPPFFLFVLLEVENCSFLFVLIGSQEET